MIAICVTPLSKNIPFIENADYIGVDAGALRILEENLPLKFAIGDFDSMDNISLDKIRSICPVEVHPIMKNETDSELAVRKCYEMGYKKVILYGGLSGRIDHTMLNIRLLSARFPNLILQDEYQRVSLMTKGRYELKNEYKNISFLPVQSSIMSLEGFLYPLTNQPISMNDTYTTSNSLNEEIGIVTIHSGCMLCLQTNEK